MRRLFEFHHYFLAQGDVFLWVEVLSAVGTPRLKDFNTKVADAWLAIKLKVTEIMVHPRYTCETDIRYKIVQAVALTAGIYEICIA